MKIRINEGTINDGNHSWPGYMDPPEGVDPQTLAIALAVKVDSADDLVSENIEFDTESIQIRIDGKVITPDDDLDNESSSVKSVAGVVFTPENVAIYESLKPLPAPEYEMEEKPYSEIQKIKGVSTLIKGVRQVPKMVLVRVKNKDGSDASQNGKALFVHEKILKAS